MADTFALRERDSLILGVPLEYAGSSFLRTLGTVVERNCGSCSGFDPGTCDVVVDGCAVSAEVVVELDKSC